MNSEEIREITNKYLVVGTDGKFYCSRFSIEAFAQACYRKGQEGMQDDDTALKEYGMVERKKALLEAADVCERLRSNWNYCADELRRMAEEG